MHLKRRWLRAFVHLSALSALPLTLPCLAQSAPESTQVAVEPGLKSLPDHDLVAVHGAGLDDAALARMRTAQQEPSEKERKKTRPHDTALAAQSTTSAQSQLLADALSRQAVHMESAMALAGATTAMRAAQIGVAQVTQVALLVPVTTTVGLPLMGLPALPSRP